MLYRHDFSLATNYNFVSIFGSKKGIPDYTDNRLQRWTTMQLDQDFAIEYFSTHSLGYANTLFRHMNVRHKPLTYEWVFFKQSVRKDLNV